MPDARIAAPRKPKSYGLAILRANSIPIRIWREYFCSGVQKSWKKLPKKGLRWQLGSENRCSTLQFFVDAVQTLARVWHLQPGEDDRTEKLACCPAIHIIEANS